MKIRIKLPGQGSKSKVKKIEEEKSSSIVLHKLVNYLFENLPTIIAFIITTVIGIMMFRAFNNAFHSAMNQTQNLSINPFNKTFNQSLTNLNDSTPSSIISSLIGFFPLAFILVMTYQVWRFFSRYNSYA